MSQVIFKSGNIALILLLIAPAAEQAEGHRLYCDLAINPAREQEMPDPYQKDFKLGGKSSPAIDPKTVKVRKVVQVDLPWKKGSIIVFS